MGGEDVLVVSDAKYEVVEISSDDIEIIDRQADTVLEVGIQGDKGDKGDKGDLGGVGPIGPPGAPGAGFQFTHNQLAPATVWTINHNLNGFPNVTIVDSAGTEVIGDVEYVSANTIRALFSAPFGGRAFLS